MSTTTGWMVVPYLIVGIVRQLHHNPSGRAIWFNVHLSLTTTQDATLMPQISHSAGCLNGAVVLIVLPTPSEDFQSWALFLSFVHVPKELIEWAGKKTAWLMLFPDGFGLGKPLNLNLVYPPPSPSPGWSNPAMGADPTAPLVLIRIVPRASACATRREGRGQRRRKTHRESFFLLWQLGSTAPGQR
ncbi:hypothetical protein LZ31DRAFT_310088 [Colletotrichum somersetense]|nr:hypothetical protein LZ31DRAFT_310088 [Colletotrichum somersetense]